MNDKKLFRVRLHLNETEEIWEKVIKARTKAIAACKFIQYAIRNEIHFDDVTVEEDKK